MWPFSRRKEPVQVRAPVIVFVGEQDGNPERELKQRLCELFGAHPGVSRAYLCRVRYGDPVESVVLALAAARDMRLVQAIGTAFAAMFRSDCALDIKFLEGDEEASLRKVCRPFHDAARRGDPRS